MNLHFQYELRENFQSAYWKWKLNFFFNCKKNLNQNCHKTPTVNKMQISLYSFLGEESIIWKACNVSIENKLKTIGVCSGALQIAVKGKTNSVI